MRISRHDHHLVRACAEAHQVHVRTARTWRKVNDPRWIRFIHQKASTANLPALGVQDVQGSGKMTPEGEEEAAARRLSALQALCDAALLAKDMVALPGLLRAGHEAAKLLSICRAATIEHNLATGRVVDRAAASRSLTTRLTIMKELLTALPERLCKLVNPDNPDLASWLLRDEVERMLRIIAEGSVSGEGAISATTLPVPQVDSAQESK
jgi:hypothetical protein